MCRKEILASLDQLETYTEKLDYLNGLFLKSKNTHEDEIILEMIERLKDGR
jgi:hypothetical protein